MDFGFAASRRGTVERRQTAQAMYPEINFAALIQSIHDLDHRLRETGLGAARALRRVPPKAKDPEVELVVVGIESIQVTVRAHRRPRSP